FSSKIRHTRFSRDWSSDVCSSDLVRVLIGNQRAGIFPNRTVSAEEAARIELPVLIARRDSVRHLAPGIDGDYAQAGEIAVAGIRSEERRVGKGWRAPVAWVK